MVWRIARYPQINHLLSSYIKNGESRATFAESQAASDVWLVILGAMMYLDSVGKKKFYFMGDWWPVFSAWLCLSWLNRTKQLWSPVMSKAGMLCACFWVRSCIPVSMPCITNLYAPSNVWEEKSHRAAASSEWHYSGVFCFRQTLVPLVWRMWLVRLSHSTIAH